MANLEAVNQEQASAVEDAYLHVVALCSLLARAGDAPMPASQLHQLLKPVQVSLDKATEN